jgi:ABC-type cobalamin/Fe3+-siderophores transport system ATPase subunit
MPILMEHRLFNDVSLQVFKGEFVSIIGENGCGKSTFLMHLNGLINPPNNAVKICGIPVSKKNAKKNHKGCWVSVSKSG